MPLVTHPEDDGQSAWQLFQDRWESGLTLYLADPHQGQEADVEDLIRGTTASRHVHSRSSLFLRHPSLHVTIFRTWRSLEWSPVLTNITTSYYSRQVGCIAAAPLWTKLRKSTSLGMSKYEPQSAPFSGRSGQYQLWTSWSWYIFHVTRTSPSRNKGRPPYYHPIPMAQVPNRPKHFTTEPEHPIHRHKVRIVTSPIGTQRSPQQQ